MVQLLGLLWYIKKRMTKQKNGNVNYRKNNLHSVAQKHHIFNSNDKLESQHCIKEHLKGTL